MEDAEADAEAHEMIGSGEVAHFKDFAVDEVGDLFAAGRDGEAALIVVEGGKFLVVLGEQIETLEARRAGEGAVAFDSDGRVGEGKSIGINEGAAFEGGTGGAGGDIGVLEGEKHVWFHFFGEVDDGGVVLQPGGVVAVLDDAFEFADTDFFAVVFESQHGEGVFGAAVFVDDSGGEKLGENHAAIGRPVERVHGVGKEFVAASEFVALKNFTALAAGVLDPDVVVLKVVLFGLDVATNRKDDAAVGREAEGGDFFVDV